MWTEGVRERVVCGCGGGCNGEEGCGWRMSWRRNGVLERGMVGVRGLVESVVYCIRQGIVVKGELERNGGV